jgi:tetratricopeptide (TPR) repeat protein
MALGNAYRLQGAIANTQSDLEAALTSFDKAIENLETARIYFETSAEQISSHNRYLAQAYEQLGEVYQGQGYAFELAFDYPSAQQAYKRAVIYFQDCIQQADDGTADLIIQNEIVGLYCQPYFEETQTRLEIISGGQ